MDSCRDAQMENCDPIKEPDIIVKSIQTQKQRKLIKTFVVVMERNGRMIGNDTVKY